MAQAPAQVAAVPADPATTGNCSQSPAQHGHAGATASRTTPRPEPPPPPKRPAHYLWAVLIARIYEVFRSCARSAAGRCASSPLSRTAPKSGTSWTTSGQIPSHRTSRQHVGRHCGMNSMRNRVRAAKSSQIGTRQHNRHRTSSWTSASVGDPSEAAVSIAAGAASRARQPQMHTASQSRHGAASERSTRLGRTCFEAQNSCHTWPHAVEFPIRSWVRCQCLQEMFIRHKRNVSRHLHAYHTQRVSNLPFWQPCLICVQSGTKAAASVRARLQCRGGG